MGQKNKASLLSACFIVYVIGLTAQPLRLPGIDSDFVLVHKGIYKVGKKGHFINPLHQATVNDFYIAKTETTNTQFEKFVIAASYRTDAERMHNAMVFQPGLNEFEWLEDSTAYWRYPNGKSR